MRIQRIEVETWQNIETGAIIQDGDALVAYTQFSEQATEAIETLLKDVPLGQMRDIIVVWLPGTETGVAYNARTGSR